MASDERAPYCNGIKQRWPRKGEPCCARAVIESGGLGYCRNHVPQIVDLMAALKASLGEGWNDGK